MTSNAAKTTLIAALLCAPFGCDGADKGSASADDTADSADSAAPDEGVTWYGDVEPLVQRSCSACHGPDGVAGVDLTDPGVAAARASAMAAYVSSGLMPPPAADPGCRPYVGSDRWNLSPEDVATFQAWAEAEAPLGDPASAPEAEVWAGGIEDPDLVLSMPFSHVVAPDRDGNEYFCMILDNPLTEPVWIAGLDVALGNAAVVHHMLLSVDLGGDAGAAYGAEDPSQGFDCRDPIMEDDWLPVHAWAPGMETTWFPEGVGVPLNPGDQIVLQMHYFSPDHNTTPDLSSYKLKLTDAALRDVEMWPIGPEGFTIPAGEPAHTEQGKLRNRWGDLTIYGTFPHMHLLGTGYRSWLADKDGAESCLTEGSYDFDHQAFYMYEEPVAWPQGSTFYGECTWDNSTSNSSQYNDPPQDVRWGEGTNEEMCYFLMYASWD